MEANATGQLVDDAALYTKKALKERNVPAYALTYVFGTPTIRNIKKDYFYFFGFITYFCVHLSPPLLLALL